MDFHHERISSLRGRVGWKRQRRNVLVRRALNQKDTENGSKEEEEEEGTRLSVEVETQIYKRSDSIIFRMTGDKRHRW